MFNKLYKYTWCEISHQEAKIKNHPKVVFALLGGPGRNRTTDTRIFNPVSALITMVDSVRQQAVNQLSYLHRTFWHPQERLVGAVT